MYSYRAEVMRVIDGDSVWLKVDVGFRMTFTDNFRLLGIDTPELRSSDPAEKEKAYAAKEELERLLGLGELTIYTAKAGKYGRWLATLYVRTPERQTINVNERLLDGGFAAPYGS